MNISSAKLQAAHEMLEKMRLENPTAEIVRQQKIEGVHVVLTDEDGVVEAVDSLFRRKSITGRKCSVLQKPNDSRNDEANLAIRFAMYSKTPVVTQLVNVNSAGHEYLNVISILPKRYTNPRGIMRVVGFYSFQIPMNTVDLGQYIPPVELPAIDVYRPEMGEVVWYRRENSFRKGRIVTTLFRTYVVEDLDRDIKYMGIDDVWPIDYVESLREKLKNRHWRRTGKPKRKITPLYRKEYGA